MNKPLVQIVLIISAIALIAWRVHHSITRKPTKFTENDWKAFEETGEAGFYAAACDETFQPGRDAFSYIGAFMFLYFAIAIHYIP